MGILDTAKEVAGLVKKAGDLELYRRIVDLQAEIVKVVGENDGLRRRVKDLEEASRLKGELRFEDNAYWIDDEGSRDGPFCSHCWDRDGKLVRQHKDETQRWYCLTHGKPRRKLEVF